MSRRAQGFVVRFVVTGVTALGVAAGVPAAGASGVAAAPAAAPAAVAVGLTVSGTGAASVAAADLTASGTGAASAAAVGLTVSADSATLVRPARTSVVLSGVYSCGPFAAGVPDRGVVDLSVVQVQGRRTVTAIGYLEPAVCDGTDQPFATTLTVTGTRRLQVGAATWSASGYVEGDTGLQHVFVPPTPISLHR